MILEQTRIGDVPPGALVLTDNGPRQFWFIPPDIVITRDASGGERVEGVVEGDAANYYVLMYVPTDAEIEAQAIMTLTATFGPLAPVSE